MKFKSTSPDQLLFLPPSLGELIPEDSLVRIVSEVIEQLDLSVLYSRAGSGGRPPYHPKILLKVLFYAYSTGTPSSRKIAQKLMQDVHFMWLAGMETPDFRTISDFRKNNIDLLKEFFKQIVLYCIELDMVSVGHISIDGTKIKASASKKQTKDADQLKKSISKLENEISELLAKAEQTDNDENKKFGKNKSGDELPHKIQKKENRLTRLKQAKEHLEKHGLKKINVTDFDGRFMKTTTHKDVSYNAQTSVDSDNQVIVANDVTTEANDYHQFIPLFEQTIENTKKEPKEGSADCGYANHYNFKYIRDKKINIYLPPDADTLDEKSTEEKSQNKYKKENFKYDSINNLYVCPEGRNLYFFCNTEQKGVKGKRYISSDCSNCSAQEQCLSKSNKSKKRNIHIYETDDFVCKMREKLKSDEGRERYKIRLKTVEPPFGNIKYNLGFRQFSLREQKKVQGEFNLMCIAHNLKKIHTFQEKKAA